jgi:hypothetical protein
MSNIKERRSSGGSQDSGSSSDLERSGSSVKRNKREELEVEDGDDDDVEATKPSQGLLKSFYYNFVPEPGTEGHRMQMGTASWLRAGVLGANDALVSVAAIMAPPLLEQFPFNLVMVINKLINQFINIYLYDR